MMPITEFLSCTNFIDDFECFSYQQKHHAKTYVTGLIASGNKTVEGISKRVLQSKSERALNKFLNQYDWDEDRLNRERLTALQQRNETRWSQDGVVILDDSVTHRTGDQLPNAGWFYDHAENDTVWGQNLVFSQYADEKTTYPLGFRLYEKEAESKIDHAKALVNEAHEVGVPADTYLFDSWYCSQELVEHVESYDRDWISVLKSNRHVEYGGEMIRVDALAERIDTTEREVDGETYNIWTKKLNVSKLGEKKVLISEKVTDDEDEENPVKYLVTNKIDAPTTQLIRTYSMRWRIETFFRDSKQDLGFEDCEVERDAGANRHWHLLMLAYSCLRLGVADSALGTVLSQTTSLCNDLKHSLQEAVQNLLSWTLNNADQGVDGLMDELEGVFI
ncbi:IS701 family transposase [Halococcus sp. AFM35]|uniref:IS701 family transposase n=1 Tax=Halococcus sp. AFM35 TaxID=3421653 RepID=UPI003EBB07B5